MECDGCHAETEWNYSRDDEDVLCWECAADEKAVYNPSALIQLRRENRQLAREKEELRTQVNDLTTQLVSYVGTVDRMKLDLILAGALTRPKNDA